MAPRSASSRSRKPAPSGDVATYLALVPRAARPALTQLRSLIRAAAPDVVEARSYGILGYKRGGKAFVYCAGWNEHVSLYPVTAAMKREHGDELAPFQASKGTLKFPIGRRLPVGLIRRLLKTRVAEMGAGRRNPGAPR
jgi:uncharacterized protein YdhG (YjbR/CyaY superfamily)